MTAISLKNLHPKKTELWGATLGKAHSTALLSELSKQSNSNDHAFVLDFANITTTSPSYLKQLLNPILGPNRENQIAPLVTNLSEDVSEDLEVFLTQRGWVVRLVSLDSSGQPSLNGFLGDLDSTARQTLEALHSAKKSSAAELHQGNPDMKIAQTAWSNRLTTLYDLLLAVRKKDGRVWIYSPTVEA